MFHNEIDGRIFGNVNLVMTINQGCQNFFEKIRTKIRTFSEEIRTIRTIFEKKSVQFLKKNPYNPYVFLTNSYNQYNFQKKIPGIRTFKKKNHF